MAVKRLIISSNHIAMKKKLSVLLTLGGVVSLTYSGIHYLNHTESFSFLGSDLTVSQGDPAAMIVSGVVLAIGLIIGQPRV